MVMRKWVLIAALSTAFCLPGAASAAPRRSDIRVSTHVDLRFGHNRSYIDRGVVVASVPRAAIVVRQGDRRYWFNGGVWYRPEGRRYVVIAPPIGAFVPALPGIYTTLRLGGVTFFYANDAYYVWRGADRGYEVVEPPADVDSAQVTAAAGSTDKIFIYPKNGQSAEQQAKDRYECHQWGADQTGFDPTLNGGGVPADQAAAKGADYQRAMSACLEARGYTVR
jgi:hypothetical protein